jgi:FkbM family methyltransferase
MSYINPSTIFEKDEQDAVLTMLRGLNSQFNLFIDIGAHIGHWTTYIGQKFAKVLAIEPSPENFPRLVERCEPLADKCVLVNKAVYDKPCNLYMRKHHSLSKDPYYHGMRCYLNEKGEYPVIADTVENIVSQTGLAGEKVDLIKMDIEGFEPIAFAGMLKLVKQYKPVMVFEIEKRWIQRAARASGRQVTVESFCRVICNLGYSATHIPQYERDTVFIPK